MRWASRGSAWLNGVGKAGYGDLSHFRSTLGTEAVSLREAVLRGLAPDGGLYVPTALPTLPEGPPPRITLDSEESDAFFRVAQWAAPAFLPGLAAEAVARVVEQACTFPVPLREVASDRFVLELFHGPTHAFKDVGARFMASLMVEIEAPPTDRIVLVATSGDTGGAVAAAFHGKSGFRVVALYPQVGVSELQRRQMTTLGDNVHAVAVRGTFDDCQRLVKSAFLDEELRSRHELTSANSINVGRLLPQALYYVYAALMLSQRGVGSDSDAGVLPRFVVPSGNLGNLCAGLLAQKAGMRASGFVAATNTNRGFVDFLGGMPFEARPSVETTSNAMDVGAPSNLERLVWLYGGDIDALRREVVGVSVSDRQVGRCIAEVYSETGYTLDPHTAVAFEAGMRHDAAFTEPIVVLATAHPAKFPETVEAMTETEVSVPPALARARHERERIHTMDATPEALAELLEDVSK